MAYKRLAREYKRLCKEPVPHIEASPEPTDLLRWHFVLTGPSDTPYFGGKYHGVLEFP
jgi:ubiquitin-conjugating enzyme E2 J2